MADDTPDLDAIRMSEREYWALVEERDNLKRRVRQLEEQLRDAREERQWDNEGYPLGTEA